MRIGTVVLASAMLALLCGCSGASPSANSPAGTGSASQAPAGSLKSDAKVCRDLAPMFGLSAKQLVTAKNAGTVLFAATDAPGGDQLSQDLSNLNSTFMLAIGSGSNLAGMGSTVVTDLQTVQQDCQSVAAAPAGRGPSAATSLTAAAQRNARRVAQALAGNSPAAILALDSATAGPVMTAYIRSQAIYAEVYAEAGQTDPAETVTSAVSGFRLCYANNDCQRLTGFQANPAGKITGFLVDGHSVSSRLTTGAKKTGNGLTIFSVTGYYFTGSGELGVLFKVRNIGQATFGSVNPAFLSVFVASDGTRYDYDASASRLPGPLQPGDIASAVAFFKTPSITGTFSLVTNDQAKQVLVSTTLRTPA